MEELKVGDLVTFSDEGKIHTFFDGPKDKTYSLIEVHIQKDVYYFDTKGYSSTGRFGTYRRFLRKVYSNSF